MRTKIFTVLQAKDAQKWEVYIDSLKTANVYLIIENNFGSKLNILPRATPPNLPPWFAVSH